MTDELLVFPLQRATALVRVDDLGARIRELRTEAGLSMSALGARCQPKLTRWQISHFEKRPGRLTIGRFENIADALNVKLRDMFWLTTARERLFLDYISKFSDDHKKWLIAFMRQLSKNASLASFRRSLPAPKKV
jgi:transcriptional regulator with XRE-family HTH domain